MTFCTANFRKVLNSQCVIKIHLWQINPPLLPDKLMPSYFLALASHKVDFVQTYDPMLFLFRHDIVMDTLGKEDDGENFSVAHFKIKVTLS